MINNQLLNERRRAKWVLARFLRRIIIGERPYKVQTQNQSKKSTKTLNKMRNHNSLNSVSGWKGWIRASLKSSIFWSTVVRIMDDGREDRGLGRLENGGINRASHPSTSWVQRRQSEPHTPWRCNATKAGLGPHTPQCYNCNKGTKRTL